MNYGILVIYVIAVVTLTAAVSNRHTHEYHSGCVVCKPSGKLAMWGECE